MEALIPVKIGSEADRHLSEMLEEGTVGPLSISDPETAGFVYQPEMRVRSRAVRGDAAIFRVSSDSFERRRSEMLGELREIPPHVAGKVELP